MPSDHKSAPFATARAGDPDLRFSDWLRSNAEPDWSAAVGHRFTRELADDSLPDAVYARYLIQDYAFLETLVNLLGYAVAYAPSMPAKSKLSAFLAAVTSEENDYFLRSFDALGVAKSVWSAATPTPVTRGFEEVMMGAARSGSYEEVLAALLPAEWIYQSWAAPVADRRPARFYLREWIELHAIPPFLAFVEWLREETDRIGEALPAERQAIMAERFCRIAELEVAFFDSAYNNA